MKTCKYLLLLLVCSLMAFPARADGRDKAEKQGWRLSIQSVTLHKFTVVETFDKACQLGLKYIEMFPGHKLGEGFGDGVFGLDMTEEQKTKLLALAKEKGIKMVSSGVWTPTREEWPKVFALAKSMGMEFISAEPARSDWDVVERLAKQYKIKVATHNHPEEASYWKPEILLDNVAKRSALLGSCADIGHFQRMDINPLEAIKQLKGRIVALHFKELTPNPGNGKLEDNEWGTGILGIRDILKELRDQKFKGYFTIEYEANWDNNLPEIRNSIFYFYRTVNELLP